MAIVSRENIGLLNDKLTVKLSKEDYLPAFEESIKKYAKKANIPGFRKGMVPSGMIKKMYGTSVFTEEVLRTVEKELTNYIQNEKPEIIGQPLPLDADARQLDMNNPLDYVFAFEIGLKPAINVDVKNITVTRHIVNVTEEMIDDEAAQLKARYGKMTEEQEVTTEENIVNLTFVECDADGKDIENGINKGNSIPVSYFAPGFRGQLIGKKKDDSFTIELSEAFEEKERDFIISDLGLSKEDRAAKDSFFNLTISKIDLIEKPEMDEEFFARAFPGKVIANEDEFRTVVREDMQQRWNAESRNQLHDQLYHQLADHLQIDFPENFLKRLIQNEQEAPKTAEEAEKEYPSFAKSLKWSLISSQLIKENNIDVEPAEIKAFAKQQIMGYMGSQTLEDAPWLDSYADSMLKEKKFLENTYFQLQTSKLFNTLENQVNVIEDTVTPEQLSEMQHHHNH